MSLLWSPPETCASMESLTGVNLQWLNRKHPSDLMPSVSMNHVRFKFLNLRHPGDENFYFLSINPPEVVFNMLPSK